MPFQKFTNGSGHRMPTRAAPIRATTVRERWPRNTSWYWWNGVP